MTDSKPKQIIAALQTLVATMTTPTYHYASANRVYRGRRDFDWYDTASFPVWSVFGFQSNVEQVLLNNKQDFVLQAAIEAHAVPTDLDNPADTGNDLIGDIVKLIKSSDTTLGGLCSLQIEESTNFQIELPEPGELIVSVRFVTPIHYREV